MLNINKIPFEIVPTGVKNTHHTANKLSISCYFEPNGHGTLLVKPSTI